MFNVTDQLQKTTPSNKAIEDRTGVKNSDYGETFNLRGNLYHQAMMKSPNAREAEFLLPLKHCNIAPGQILIDFPAGGGYLGRYLPKDVTHICMESSSLFADFCRDAGHHHVQLADSDTFPLSSDYADRLISVAGMHHVTDKRPLFREIKRVLKPSGIACIADVEKGSNIASFLDIVVDRYTTTGHVGSYFDRQTYVDLSSIGFKSVKRQVLNYHWQFKSVDEMVEYAQTLFGMTKANKQQVLDGIDRYLNYSIKENLVSLEWQLTCFITSN